MGPFGISAVGMLMNKDSASKKKKHGSKTSKKAVGNSGGQDVGDRVTLLDEDKGKELLDSESTSYEKGRVKKREEKGVSSRGKEKAEDKRKKEKKHQSLETKASLPDKTGQESVPAVRNANLLSSLGLNRIRTRLDPSVDAVKDRREHFEDRLMVPDVDQGGAHDKGASNSNMAAGDRICLKTSSAGYNKKSSKGFLEDSSGSSTKGFQGNYGSGLSKNPVKDASTQPMSKKHAKELVPGLTSTSDKRPSYYGAPVENDHVKSSGRTSSSRVATVRVASEAWQSGGNSFGSRNTKLSGISEELAVISESSPKESFISKTIKEHESSHPQYFLQMAGDKGRKKAPADMRSFSHELHTGRIFSHSSHPHGNDFKVVVSALQERFNNAKQEVDAELAVFAADLVETLENKLESNPEWKESVEDLLVLARRCAMMSPEEFREQCEHFVQKLDDTRQSLAMGLLKQLHTRMLFILTRCTRLLQYRKESGIKQAQSLSGPLWRKDASKLSYFQQEKPPELKHSNLKKVLLSTHEALELPKADKGGQQNYEQHEISTLKPQNRILKSSQKVPWVHKDQHTSPEVPRVMCRICEDKVPTPHLQEHIKVCVVADRCDSKSLGIDDRLRRLAETLEKMAEAFNSKSQVASQDGSPALARSVGSQEGSPILAKSYSSKTMEGFEDVSPNKIGVSRRGSEDMLCDLHEIDAANIEELRAFSAISCRTRFGPKLEQGLSSSSTGSITPHSPVVTPRTSHIEALLADWSSLAEFEDPTQIIELAELARCIASTNITDEGVSDYLVAYSGDLQELLEHGRVEALTLDTFGKRIENLLREKYALVPELPDRVSMDAEGNGLEEYGQVEGDRTRGLMSATMHPTYKDRTSIEDFEIIKPISRGAYGRVFLARKRTTGDLFAVKVLRKVDMVCKNAVESILAERDILISVRNPFVVRFFYSFTSRENLYLVMEYLVGGDLYSLLRNVGCLDEDVVRMYIAEVVLALEYLHSLSVVHRDLKPDNLLIAHDGHIKLTDFGLSKVGLINSTDELSGAAYADSTSANWDLGNVTEFSEQRERRKKQSAVGTPDYLAPEILLGTGHGFSADWWSTGIILYELLVGVPPFSDESPQAIFDNIFNCKITWPRVPEEMSFEAKDLIDKLLVEDPHERLGARGAHECTLQSFMLGGCHYKGTPLEGTMPLQCIFDHKKSARLESSYPVKKHPFFKDINWDTLARQKAAFVPTPESAFDTSYFSSRHNWDSSDMSAHSKHQSDASSIVIGDNSDSTEIDDTPLTLSFSNFSFKNLSMLASINYDLLVQSGIFPERQS